MITKESFGIIQDKNTKPLKKGYYITSFSENACMRMREGHKPGFTDFSYWDGYIWRIFKHFTPCLIQERYWFGLKEPYRTIKGLTK